nr:NAD(P)H-dependent oxidoreductase [Propionibacterium sp.]
MKKLSIIVSSTRPQRVGAPVTAWVQQTLASDWAVTILDLAAINLPFLDEPQPAGSGVYTQPHTLAWKAAVDDADAILVVTPEYNGFFPAPLKNAVDYLMAEWEEKPMALVGYGCGGGRRALAALTQLLTNVKARVVGSLELVFGTDLTTSGEIAANAEKVAELRELARSLADATEREPVSV